MKGKPSEQLLADWGQSDLTLTLLPYAVRFRRRCVLLFQKCTLLMEKGQVATLRPLKNKLHLFVCVCVPNKTVKIVFSCTCLTVDSDIMRWSATYFKPSHFRKKVRRPSGDGEFKVNHPVQDTKFFEREIILSSLILLSCIFFIYIYVHLKNLHKNTPVHLIATS